MGTCYNCGRQLTLKEDEVKCDNCEAIVVYVCNNCRSRFNVIDKDGKKLPECKMCGYFKCPTCNSCGNSCAKHKIEKGIRSILLMPISDDKMQRILDLIEGEKITAQKINCPIRGVPVSYAKNKIKTMMARAQGFRVRNIVDQLKFARRETRIINMPIGEKFTISQKRESGSLGYEFRDVCNMLVCKGKLKIIVVPKTKDKHEYVLYERIDGAPCQYLLEEKNLIISHCATCKKDYDKTVTRCTNCLFKHNTKNGKKGEGFPLKQKLHDNDTCQLYRGKFKRKGEKDEVKDDIKDEDKDDYELDED